MKSEKLFKRNFVYDLSETKTVCKVDKLDYYKKNRKPGGEIG